MDGSISFQKMLNDYSNLKLASPIICGSEMAKIHKAKLYWVPMKIE